MNDLMMLVEPETENSVVKPLVEEAFDLMEKKVKKLKITGTAIVCDVVGINGRAYPLRILKPEVDRFRTKMIRRGRAAAELNHPRLDSKGEGKDYSVFEMNQMKICALIEELDFHGKDLFCKMVVVDDDGCAAGQALGALLRAGYVPGYSLRGAGSVVEAGNHLEVGDDYRLITVDVVGNPSFDDKALIEPLHEAIKSGKIAVLTESVEHATREFLHNCDVMARMKTGRKTYSTAALESYMRGLGKPGLFS
jgi:hypothetical protein